MHRRWDHFLDFLRLGSNVIVSADKDLVDNFKGYIGGAVRTTVSGVSTFSQAILKAVLKKENEPKPDGEQGILTKYQKDLTLFYSF